MKREIAAEDLLRVIQIKHTAKRKRVLDVLQRNLEEEAVLHQRNVEKEVERYQQSTDAENVRFTQRMKEHEDIKKRMIWIEKCLPRACLLQMFEVECLGGRSTCPCIVDWIDGETVHCIESVAPASNGLTFETFDIMQSEFSSRLENKTADMLLPSTSTPSLRGSYRGFDRVQVACRNGALWWNAVVISMVRGSPVRGSPELIVQLETVDSSTRPVRVKLSSVRLKDWFKLHERCRTSLCMVFWFLNQNLHHDMAKFISQKIWETRDDREWDY